MPVCRPLMLESDAIFARVDTLVLPNRDFDTGNETGAGEYSLADSTYAKLLGKLSGRKFDLTSAALRDNILQFYSDVTTPIENEEREG